MFQNNDYFIILDRNDYLDSANEIMSSRIQSLLPPFALTSDNINNLKCKEDSQKFLKNLNEMNLWALKSKSMTII